MDCFGNHDERHRACTHCWVARQCKSFRTTHGEGIEAAILEATLEDMTEEEVEMSPYVQLVLNMGKPVPVASNRAARRASVTVPSTPLSQLD